MRYGCAIFDFGFGFCFNSTNLWPCRELIHEAVVFNAYCPLQGVYDKSKAVLIKESWTRWKPVQSKKSVVFVRGYPAQYPIAILITRRGRMADKVFFLTVGPHQKLMSLLSAKILI